MNCESARTQARTDKIGESFGEKIDRFRSRSCLSLHIVVISMIDSNSYRMILQSSAVIGVAQIFNILGAFIRIKVVAVLAGPTGVGLVGLYASLVQITAIAAALGMVSVGTRKIAATYTKGDHQAVNRTRRTLFWATLAQAMIGTVVFFLLADWIAQAVLHDPAQLTTVRWLSLAVAVTVAGGYQTAVLAGTRRMVEIAKISIGASILGSVLACAAILFLKNDGFVTIVLFPPLVSLVIGCFLLSKLEPVGSAHVGLRELLREWAGLSRLGLVFMVTALIALLGHLVVRILIQNVLGLDALGHFQASWNLSATCLALVIGAMGTDYFPRLSAAVAHSEDAVRAINQQIEVGLLLCAPIFLALIGLAPWVIELAYSSDFTQAVEVLRFQILGDILKVISWPLAMAIVARGSGLIFLLTETFSIAFMIVLISIGIPILGLKATGVAFLITNAAYLPLVLWFGGRPLGFRWSKSVIIYGIALLITAVAIGMVARISNPLGAISGAMCAVLFGALAFIHISNRIQPLAFVGKLTRALKIS